MNRLIRFMVFVAVAAIACLALAQLPVFAATGAADGPNLLINGGMDGKFVMQCSARGGALWAAVPCGDPIDFGAVSLWQTVQVPVGWTAWWQPPYTDEQDPNFYNSFPYRCASNAPPGCAAWHNPEYRDTAGGPQTPPSRKVAGDNSQKYFTFYSVHEAGLYQIVGGLRPGQRLRFSVYMEAWSSQANDPAVSAGQPTMGMKVGIDPFGGNNPWSPNIVWSPVNEAFDHWELFTIEAVAQSDRVTVFTRSRPYFALQHNDVYVDEASLVVVGSVAGNATTPRPTAQPQAPTNFTVGSQVQVSGTGGQRLRLRASPGMQADTVTRVTEGTLMRIVEGPRTVDGLVWWKVRDPQSNEGWAAQRFLRSTARTPTATATLRSTATPRSTRTPAASITPAPGGLKVGGFAVVSGTNGQRLRLRAEAGLNSREQTRVFEGVRLALLEGPIVADGFAWWRVRDLESSAEGWAVQKYLVPASAP